MWSNNIFRYLEMSLNKQDQELVINKCIKYTNRINKRDALRSANTYKKSRLGKNNIYTVYKVLVDLLLSLLIIPFKSSLSLLFVFVSNKDKSESFSYISLPNRSKSTSGRLNEMEIGCIIEFLINNKVKVVKYIEPDFYNIFKISVNPKLIPSYFYTIL